MIQIEFQNFFSFETQLCFISFAYHEGLQWQTWHKKLAAIPPIKYFMIFYHW